MKDDIAVARGTPLQNIMELATVLVGTTLMRGFANMDRHVANIRDHYGLPVIVALNRFDNDVGLA